jgi:hypothetical protein
MLESSSCFNDTHSELVGSVGRALENGLIGENEATCERQQIDAIANSTLLGESEIIFLESRQ